MGFIGLKTLLIVGPRTLCRRSIVRYRLNMKFFSFAAALAFLPAAIPAFSQAAPQPESQEKADLLNDIEAWRATQLPHLSPPAQLTARLEPRLDEIKTEVKGASDDSGLTKPRKELETWKKELLRQKFSMARSEGLTHGSLAQYSDEQTQQAEFSAALHAALAQVAVERGLVRTEERAMSAAANPARFFDGAKPEGGLSSAGPTAVTAPPPADSNDPARYAKVREILISQGKSASVVDMAINEALRQKADPLLVLAVINSESGFNARATSPAGARGLMQIMPNTGRGLGVQDSDMLYDAQTNLRAGIGFLKSLWGEFVGGSMTALAGMDSSGSHGVQSAVAAYNAGEGAVKKYDGVPPYRETQGYVKTVLGYYNRFKQYMNA